MKEEQELESLARELLEILSQKEGGAVLALSGDLGVGKTALTKALGRTLGIVDSITSPTFVIMKSYPVSLHERFKTLTHIDAYRIEDESELLVLGIQDIFSDPNRLTVIEWPERIETLVPENVVYVRMQIGKDEERIVTYD